MIARFFPEEKKLPVRLLSEFEQLGSFGGIVAYYEGVGREFGCTALSSFAFVFFRVVAIVDKKSIGSFIAEIDASESP